MSKPFVIGITGPVHSGKSTASKILEAHGFVRFDADQAVWSLYQDPAVLDKVASCLGKDALIDGALNKDYVSSLVRNDPKAKTALEAILHPLVKKEAERFLLSLEDGQKAVLDVPLLFPSHMDCLCGITILVLAPSSLREKRLSEEGKDAKAQMKLNEGYPLEEAKEKATFVLENDGSVETLEEKLLKVLN